MGVQWFLLAALLEPLLAFGDWTLAVPLGYLFGSCLSPGLALAALAVALLARGRPRRAVRLEFGLALAVMVAAHRHQEGLSWAALGLALFLPRPSFPPAERVLLFGLAPLSLRLAQHWPPGLALVVLALLVLRRSALKEARLREYEEGSGALHGRSRGVEKRRRQLAEHEQAQAEAFSMLETLSQRCRNRQEALSESLAILQQRFPQASWSLWAEGQPLARRGPEAQSACSEKSWPLGHGAELRVAWDGLPAEAVQASLDVFIRCLALLLERADFQERLFSYLTGLERLLEASARLNSDVSQPDLRFLATELGARVVQTELGWGAGPQAVVAGPLGSLTPAGPLDPARQQLLGLWARLLAAACERSLAQARFAQAAKLAAIGQLAAGVAHELNTPLGALTLALDGAAKNLTLKPERTQSSLDRAQRSVTQMQSIISKLLFYARESGQGRRAVFLGELVRDSLSLLEHQLEGIEVQLRDTSQRAVSADPGELQQVVSNLLTNAIASLKKQTGPRVLRVALEERSEAVELWVEDSGPGVPPEIQDRIFEPFFTTREVGEGTGLGLSVARQIAEQHGGELRFLGGSRFVLRLPLQVVQVGVQR